MAPLTPLCVSFLLRFLHLIPSLVLFLGLLLLLPVVWGATLLAILPAMPAPLVMMLFRRVLPLILRLIPSPFLILHLIQFLLILRPRLALRRGTPLMQESLRPLPLVPLRPCNLILIPTCLQGMCAIGGGVIPCRPSSRAPLLFPLRTVGAAC